MGIRCKRFAIQISNEKPFKFKTWVEVEVSQNIVNKCFLNAFFARWY